MREMCWVSVVDVELDVGDDEDTKTTAFFVSANARRILGRENTRKQ